MEWDISTVPGPWARLLVRRGSVGASAWGPSRGERAGSPRPQAPRGPPAAISPTAAGSAPRKLRLDTSRGREAPCGVMADRDAAVSVSAGIELGPSVRPVDVGLQRLHRVPVGGDLHPLVRLL